MLRNLALLACLTGAISAAPAQPAPAQAAAITTRSLLEEMIDRDAIARFPLPAYTCRQFSSYDRASTSPSNAQTWFANGDANQYLRTEENGGRKEWVMMDTDGPGAVVRFWSANPAGNVRIYLDGAAEPVLTVPMNQLLTGRWKIEPPLSGIYANGCNLYLPIPYTSHCKITSDKDGFYYQINYRTYEKGTVVRSFAAQDIQDLATSISTVQSALSTPPRIAAEPISLFAGELTPESSVSKGLPDGPSAVSRLWVKVKSADMEEALRATILQMTFDGEQTIWCPLGDFFCSGVGFNAFDSWYSAAKGEDQLISRWTMPYRQHASIKIVNLGSKTVAVELAHRTTGWDWDDRSMHLFATWHQQNPIHTRPMSDFNYVQVTGKGVYAGDCLSILNPVPEWWGEGDEKIYVDGEAFPSHFGTGTEDYYGYAWSSPKRFQHAFHGQTRSDGEKDNSTRGYSTVFRTRSLDAIPFTRGIKTDIEIWHWVECDAGYAATTFFYALPGATHNRPPSPAEAAKGIPPVPPPPPPFKIQGAVECEQMVVRSAAKATAAPQNMQDFARNKWSNESQLWIQGRDNGASVELEIPAPTKEPHKLTLYATRSWDYGILKITVNGNPAVGDAGSRLDMYSGQQGLAAPSGPIELGTFSPENGMYILKAEIVGTNEKTTGAKFFFGLDCVVLTPAK